MKLALLFDHFGPYHLARQRGAAGAGLEVTGVEFYSRSRDYAWAPTDAGGLAVETVCRSTEVTKAQFREALWAVLDRLKPDGVAIPGWSAGEALAAWQWCTQRKVPGVLMSESCAHDEKRVGWKEWVKSQVVGCCSAALAGGSLHQTYLELLGLDRSRIFLGYDVVDNAYFEQGAIAAGAEHSQAGGVFLASARFIAKKNLDRLISAYASYREGFLKTGREPWKLLLLGDGELRPDLEAQVKALALTNSVSMPGFLQYETLPAQYAKASAFIHASTTEQWGLVVNEAMASGLPVIVSNRCGSAADLVQNGVNGFAFDPYDVEALTAAMTQLSSLPAAELEAMSQASRKLVGEWGPERFGQGMKQAVERAVKSPRKVGLASRAVVELMSRR